MVDVLHRARQTITADPRLLEHLLEYHPTTMIPRFTTELTSGNRRFKKAVASCDNFGDSRSRARIQKVIDAATA